MKSGYECICHVKNKRNIESQNHRKLQVAKISAVHKIKSCPESKTIDWLSRATSSQCMYQITFQHSAG